MPQLFSTYTALVLSLVTLALACARSCRHGFLQPGTAVSLVAAAVAVTLFVPKPSTDADCQSCGVLGLASIVHHVRWRSSPSVAIVTHFVTRSLMSWSRAISVSPHAFQVCGSVFTVGRRRLRPAVAWPGVAGCTRADVAE